MKEHGATIRAELSLSPKVAAGLVDFLKPGCRSLLFVFDSGVVEDPQRTYGAVVEAASEAPLTPGRWDVDLWFWNDEAEVFAVPNATFDVWYGGIVGHGVVLGFVASG